MTRMKLVSTLVVCVLALAAAPAMSADYYLIAKEFNKTLPDGTEVKMWGFAEDVGGACWNTIPNTGPAGKAARMASASCTGPAASSPGPRIEAAPTIGNSVADRVRIHLVNLLDSTAGGEPISLVIPGQPMPYRVNAGPTWEDGTVGAGAGGGPGVRRVRSFGREAGANGGRNRYMWLPTENKPLKDGTYLYHSGTHPQVQVQMGLYGAITRDAAAGEAYGPDSAYDNEATVLYSEIDTDLHDAVTSGTYGTLAGPTSTFAYHPQYYLVNGEPFDPADIAGATISGLALGDTTLLRLLNAGLQTHTAALNGLRMSIIAEDGNVYPAARNEPSAVLAPLKTRDAILTPMREGTFALYDGQLNLSNTDGSAGGMLSFLQVGAGTGPPNTAPVGVVDPAVAGAYDTDQNNALAVVAPGVLGNDTDAEGDLLAVSVLATSDPTNGTLILNTDGSFLYTPALNFNGIDTFTYRATDGALESADTTASITVNFLPNNPPVADDQSVTTGQQLAGGNSEAVELILTGSDPDDNPMFFTVTGGPTSGSLVGVAPNLTYTPNLGFAGSDSFTYKATDSNAADSLVDATVDITVVANQAPIADVDTATTMENQVVAFSVTDNDTDPDLNGTIDVTSVVITKQPKHADSLIVNADGTVTYDPVDDYSGSDTFRYRVRDDDGALSTNPNGGPNTKVRININPIFP
jgi:FtsP/CotA-like multicopper oxidase with cupredoxin domain